jgi:trimethylguanosine synthase
MAQSHRVRVLGLPTWLDLERLLGVAGFEVAPEAEGTLRVEASLDRVAAADLAARLRGVGLGGRAIEIEILPPLRRADVRRARTEEARRLREGSGGFLRGGTHSDEEGKRSLTPEAIALELAQRAGAVRVVDAGCGLGGNAIAFARAGARVVAIEADAQRLALARHNASIYGVRDRIDFRLGDAVVLVPSLEADLLFVDPPWGERYDKTRVTLSELPLLARMLEQRTRFGAVWAKVPASFDPSGVPGASVRAIFGVGRGDARRVKFLLLELQGLLRLLGPGN